VSRAWHAITITTARRDAAAASHVVVDASRLPVSLHTPSHGNDAAPRAIDAARRHRDAHAHAIAAAQATLGHHA